MGFISFLTIITLKREEERGGEVMRERKVNPGD